MTDYHAQIRDAMVTVLQAAITAEGYTLTVTAVDAPDDMLRLTVPLVAAACVGPEIERSDWGTNAETGRGYPVAIALLTHGTTRGEQVPGMPDATQFRRLLTTTFEFKRLSGVSRVGYCEVSDSGELWDPKEPRFQHLATAMVVTAIGRFPRT